MPRLHNILQQRGYANGPEGQPETQKSADEKLRATLRHQVDDDNHKGKENRRQEIAGIGDEIDFVLGALKPLLDGEQSGLDDLMIFLTQPDFLAPLEQHAGDLLLVRSEHALIFVGEGEHIGTCFFPDFQVAARGHVQNCGGERLVVEAHADQIAHTRRRESRRWIIERHDDPRTRVAAHLRPGNQIVEKQDQEAGTQEKRVAIVPEEIFGFL